MEPPVMLLRMTILTGNNRYSDVRVPSLVIFAIPHVPESWIGKSRDTKVRETAKAYFKTVDVLAERQAKAFEAGVPAARVIRLRGAHYIFLADEPGVLREMRAFLASLR